MTQTDPTRLAAEMKRAAAMLRDARMLLRRVDRLVADAGDDPVRRDLESLRDHCESIVTRLAHRERALQRQAHDAVRRLR